jgi:hypothetical protein
MTKFHTPTQTKVVAELLSLLLRIWYVVGSNLGPETGYPDRKGLWFSSVLPNKCWNITLKQASAFFWLTPWSRVLEKLIFPQAAKKLPAFYGNLCFITVFTSARHWFISWTRWSPHPPTIISLRSIIILFSHLHLDLPSDLFPSDFLTKIL